MRRAAPVERALHPGARGALSDAPCNDSRVRRIAEKARGAWVHSFC